MLRLYIGGGKFHPLERFAEESVRLSKHLNVSCFFFFGFMSLGFLSESNGLQIVQITVPIYLLNIYIKRCLFKRLGF
jgi:hypothetical protein